MSGFPARVAAQPRIAECHGNRAHYANTRATLRASAALAGISVSGGFALAATRFLPRRIAKVLLVSAMVPIPPQVRKGMSRQDRIGLFVAARWPRLTATLMKRAFPENAFTAAAERFIKSLPEPNRRVPKCAICSSATPRATACARASSRRRTSYRSTHGRWSLI